MNNRKHNRQLKNAVFLEIESENEVRTDIADRILKNSSKKCDYSNSFYMQQDGENT